MMPIRKLSGRFTEADIDDEIVIMRIDSGEFFGLSGTAAAAWRLIDGTRDRAALLSALAGEFGTAQNAIAADIDDLLARLRETGLLEDG